MSGDLGLPIVVRPLQSSASNDGPFTLIFGPEFGDNRQSPLETLGIARIVKTLVLSVLSFIHKSFTSSASFWESRYGYIQKEAKTNQLMHGMGKDKSSQAKSVQRSAT
ncbi:hypothetical protein Tco_0150157 [Tanacetum coccineum]